MCVCVVRCVWVGGTCSEVRAKDFFPYHVVQMYTNKHRYILTGFIYLIIFPWGIFLIFDSLISLTRAALRRLHEAGWVK